MLTEEEPDPLAPYICLGCGSKFLTCPDPHDHNCPHCGEKVCPRQMFKRAVRCTTPFCHGEKTFVRAGGECVCLTCGETYRDHPHCVNSALPEQLSGSTRPEYILHVVCGGMHVKL